jgi:hypothetical protein
MKSANLVFLILGGCDAGGVAYAHEGFLTTSEAGDAEDEGFTPRWYHRLVFAAFSVAIIVWNAVKLYR